MKILKTLTRRSLLKTSVSGAVGLGIISLLPDEARANGSWASNSNDYNQTTAIDSYRRARNANTTQQNNRYVVPFSNDWRQKQNW